MDVKRIIKLSLVILCSLSFSSLSFADQTFIAPKRANQWGTLKMIFINSTTGTKFCEEEGWEVMTGGTIYCGEDESGYVNYSFSQQRWVAQSTGSKNQCYPLYATITCGFD